VDEVRALCVPREAEPLHSPPNWRNAFTCARDLKPRGQVEPLALLLTLSIMLAKPVSD